ncbi:MAG: OmpA family protein [Nitrospira sp.]|nr:OmpA family protein [Nitrospira sp.]
MKSLSINLFVAGTSMILLTGCADLNPALVEVNAVCRDGWYGYWQRPCEQPPPPYGVADAQREIADLKAEVQSLKSQLAAANQLIARLSEDQARIQNHMTLAKVEKDLLRALQPEIARGTVSVVPSNDGLTINLNSTLLFAPGQDRLQADGEETLKRVGTVLKDFPERQIRVVGHTDATPIRGALQKKFSSNKELSDARARNAVEALQKGGFRGAVSAEGRGDSTPIATNDTPQGRAQNRRIEVLVSL